MPKKVIVLLMMLTILMLKPVCGFAQEKIIIKIGLLPIVESLPLVLSASQPEVVNSNVTVKFEVFSTWTALEAAYRTGMIDLMGMTASKAIKMASQNVPLKMLMSLHRNGDMFVTNFKQDSAENFKGKMIGVSGNDTGQLLLLAEFIKKQGVGLGTDVRYIPIPQSKAIELFRSERIQGFVLSEPYGQMAIEEGLAVKAVPGSLIKKDFIDVILVAMPKILETNPKEIQLLASAIRKSGDVIENDVRKSGAKQISLTQMDVLGIDPELIQKALTYPKSNIKFDNMSMSLNELQEIQKAALALGILDTSSELDNFIETKFSR